MTNKLLNTRLSAILPTDPAIALWTYIKSKWADVTGYTVPAVGSVKFDTKFGDMILPNMVIIENMPVEVKPQQLGGTRFRNKEVKRLQILCTGPSCLNNHWNIQKHIESIINGDLNGMQTTYGMDAVRISQFTEIEKETETTKSTLQIGRVLKVRSYALIEMTHELYQAAI